MAAKVVLAMLLSAALAAPAAAQSVEPPARSLELKLADVVEALAEYSVIYDSSKLFCAQYWGLTDYIERTITICGAMDFSLRKATMIHELLHVVSLKRSTKSEDQYTEAEIEAATHRIYAELYGEK